jgi:hypothetical protein
VHVWLGAATVTGPLKFSCTVNGTCDGGRVLDASAHLKSRASQLQ